MYIQHLFIIKQQNIPLRIEYRKESVKKDVSHVTAMCYRTKENDIPSYAGVDREYAITFKESHGICYPGFIEDYTDH